MRILYLTAHLSDVDVAQRALEKSANAPVRLDPCANVRDVTHCLSEAPADGVVVDVTPAHGDVTRLIRELREAAPHTAIIALVRAGATTLGAEALLAGADETLVKQGEFFLQLPGMVAQASARQQASERHNARNTRVLVVGCAPPALAEGARLLMVSAGDDWWLAPAETTTAATPEAIVIDDARGPAAVVAAIRTLRGGGRFEPVVLLTDRADEETRGGYQRVAVAACVPRAEVSRLPEVVDRVVRTNRLEGEVLLLRAKEQRLRALIETIPTTVALVGADGTVQAMNLAGLALVGARESAQMVGKPFTSLCGKHEAEGVRAFVTKVCAGTPGLVRFSGQGLDGVPHVFEFRSVPLRRDRDTASALGVMRVVPAEPRALEVTVAAPDTDVVILLDGALAQAPPVAAPEPLEMLRQQLETTLQAHDVLQARLVGFEAQRAVTDSAWNAVQSELERRLILQAASAAEEQEREAPLAHLEQSLREKDAQLLALSDERDASVASLRHAEAAAVRAQAQIAERAAEVTSLQEALTDAEAARDAGHTGLSEVTAELSMLRTLSTVHHREQATLADVRQQMARLQAETATIEQQRRDLDEASDRAERLRLALEHALGTHTELQQQLRDSDAAGAMLGQELEQARAALAERTADAEHRATLQERLAQFETERDRLRLEHEQLRAQNALAAIGDERNALQRALADESEGRTHDATVIAELRARLEQLDAESSDARAAADVVREDAAVLRAAVALARADNATLHDLVAAAESARNGLLDDERRLRLEHEQLQARHAALEREHETATRDLQTALESARTTTQELATLQHDRNDAMFELARERALHGEAQRQRVEAESAGTGLAARLAGVEEDLASARASLAAIAEERNTLKQALADESGARVHDAGVTAALRARLEQLEAELAETRGVADAIQKDASTLRAAVDAARHDTITLQDLVATTESARNNLLDDERRLRDQLAQAHARVAEHRQRVAELEAEREHLHDALARADAGAQLIASRHLDERDAVQRALDELRGAFTEAEARWAAQRAEVEQALAARADAHRRLSESGVVGLATTTIDGQLLRCNDALARFCGYATAADLLTHPGGVVLPLAVDGPAFAKQLATASAPIVVEACVQHPDGRIAWLHAGATLVCGDTHAASAVDWTVVDATDRYLRMRQLKQARRLDAIRELAVSAGHEVVEQLGTVAHAPNANESPEWQSAHRAVARAREVAHQLVTFARNQGRLPQLLDINETVAQLRPTLRRLSGGDVTFEVALWPGALVVSTDPAETEQWMTSLAVACRDALPSGGSLTVSSRALDVATGGTGGERRVTPAAQVSLIACGLGARPVTVPASLTELLSHRGGTLRPSHDGVTNVTRVDVYLPLVRPTRSSDAPFPLLRTELAALTPESTA